MQLQYWYYFLKIMRAMPLQKTAILSLVNSETGIHSSAFNSLNHKPGDVKQPQTHLCLLGSSLFLFFSTTLHVLIILASLIE
jgi:hypothetical protein